MGAAVHVSTIVKGRLLLYIGKLTCRLIEVSGIKLGRQLIMHRSQA
jgi:hypothetical protein